MRSNYKRLGDYIRQVDIRNKDDERYDLLGVSVEKCFISSIANTVGTDWHNYKIIKKGQFCYIPDTSRRGDKIGIAHLTDREIGLVSAVYTVFEVWDEELVPEYLMLWFKRPEFDRYARFHSHGSVREIFDWEEMCNVELPIPPIEEQKAIVNAYETIERRIALKRKINDNLEEQARAIFRQFIVSSSDMHTYQMTELFDIKYGKGLATSDLQEKGYFVFGSNGLIGRYTQYMYEKEQITISCRGASSGKVNISLPKSFITSNSLILECKKPYQYEFLKAFCKTFSFEEYVTGSAQPQLTIDSLLNVSVELPNLSNIHGISSVLGTISAAIQTNTLELISILENRELLLDTILHL